MKRIALTGGIGCGKSTVTAYFRQTGFWYIFDTDAICHDLYAGKDPALIDKMCSIWGAFIRNSDGGIDRRQLASIVFQDSGALAELNSLVHPAIHRQIQLGMAELPENACVLFDVPLLFESGWTLGADATAAVWAPPEIQYKRLLERGWTPEQIEARLAAQLSAAEKLERADFGIINGSGLDALYEQCCWLDRCWRQTCK